MPYFNPSDLLPTKHIYSYFFGIQLSLKEG